MQKSIDDQLAEMQALLSQFPDAAVEVRSGLESGLPLLRAKVDAPVAIGANAEIVGFELTEWMQAHLTALRARNLDANEIVGAVG